MPAIRILHSAPADPSAAVDAFAAPLDHPHADAAQALLRQWTALLWPARYRRPA